MMELEKSDAWRRHQLAAVERMQRDLARYTHLLAVEAEAVADVAG